MSPGILALLNRAFHDNRTWRLDGMRAVALSGRPWERPLKAYRIVRAIDNYEFEADWS